MPDQKATKKVPLRSFPLLLLPLVGQLRVPQSVVETFVSESLTNLCQQSRNLAQPVVKVQT